jgi:hypothetical protein
MKILEDADFQKYLEDNQWTIECESPLEVRHAEGSFATNYAAKVLLNELHSQYKDENVVEIETEEYETAQMKTFKKLEKVFNIMDNYIQAAWQVEKDYPVKESDEDRLSPTAYDVWKKTYNFVFDDEVSVKIRAYLTELDCKLNYYSDYSYKEDLIAFYDNVKKEVDNLTKIFCPSSNKMKM